MFGYGQITGGYDGGQAEYVRVPFANAESIKIPDQLSEEQVLFLSDALCTGYFAADMAEVGVGDDVADRKSTRLNSSHANISYAVFCLKKKKVSYCQDAK